MLSLSYVKKNNIFFSHIKEYGYTDKVLISANSLLNNSKEINSYQTEKLKKKSEAVAELARKKSAAKKIYMRHLKIARILFENNPLIIKALELNGKRAAKTNEFIIQVKGFYENALESDNVKTGFKQHGITKLSLNEGLDLINDVSQFLRVVERVKGEAIKATLEKKENLREVYAWYSKFVKISKIALEDDPKELKKFTEMIKG
ncbi:MAG: hypothetical protein JEY94_04010 [Melioribacteraceae bacterium]|nr:hypothetical protein [Melioribacteraceae bacterium]